MPFIVRVLADDLEQWELYEHEVSRGPTYVEEQQQSRRPFHYRLQQRVYRPEFSAIKLDAPDRLDRLLDQDLFCFINIEKGYLNEKTGDRPSVRFKLDRLTRSIIEPARRLRLRIESVDTSKHPPRVMLEEWKNGR
jgi:hypothetical protein